MTAALAFTPADGWTTDDLDAMPEDGLRRELIDGVLHMPPTPHESHQTMAMLLGARLYASRPSELHVTQAVEVRINRQRSLIPDVMVVDATAAARNPSHFAPSEVVLAIEIVSPTSRAIDRVLKPSLYAEAGIPYYWRIEPGGTTVVHTYALDLGSGLYRPTGEHDHAIQVDAPWAISIPISEITSQPTGNRS
ncbi:MAG TPA: Uma2 family endonuclease [Micromonosporaceae bacterium]|nr:Uma2 family endonuclease [Micromonosporaceae bacterium]